MRQEYQEHDYGIILGYLEKEYNITIEELSEIVMDQQKEYVTVNLNEAINAIKKVASKNEIINAFQVAVELDEYANNGLNTMNPEDIKEKTLLHSLINDSPTFGVDENLVMGFCGLYGSIATTNYGYLDRSKVGVIGKLNDLGKKKERVTTMIDDVVAGMIACAEAYLSAPTKEENMKNSLK